MTEIHESISQTLERIRTKLIRSHRDPEMVTVVAVTKNRPVEVIETALNFGITDIGENRVQEAKEKVPLIQATAYRFHFIGHLQSNKINALLDLEPWLIHSLDSEHLARKLDAACIKRQRIQDVLIQVNASKEDRKSGVSPERAIDLISYVSKLTHLRVKGLMTIGILEGTIQENRGCFRTLKRIYDEAAGIKMPNVEMRILSMGMTDDFELALEEGSNCLRIGSAFFGSKIKGN